MSFDTSKPAGALRKVLDVSRLIYLGLKARTTLHEQIRIVYVDFLKGMRARLSVCVTGARSLASEDKIDVPLHVSITRSGSPCDLQITQGFIGGKKRRKPGI